MVKKTHSFYHTMSAQASPVIPKIAHKKLRIGKSNSINALPDRILPLKNADKSYHEHWYQGRNLLDIPHPFRMLLASKPNSGKSTLIKNVLMRVALGRHPFKEIFVVHCDPEATQEYADLDATMLHEVPAPDSFDSKVKTAVILEDLDYVGMSQEQRGRLERLYGYVSTHKNVSVFLTAQDPFRVPVTVRRCTNVFVLWPSRDHDMIRSMARKTGIAAADLVKVFAEQCTRPHDHLWFDFTPESPSRFRKNGYQNILLE